MLRLKAAAAGLRPTVLLLLLWSDPLCCKPTTCCYLELLQQQKLSNKINMNLLGTDLVEALNVDLNGA